MSFYNQNIANISNLDELSDGEMVYIKPLHDDPDFKILVRIQRITTQNEPERLKKLGISRFSINYHIDRTVLKEIINQILQLPDEFEELWHRDYGEIDSGNIIDSSGEASGLLDNISKSMEWGNESPRFDKFILRKRDNYRLSEFHTDHYCSQPERTRSKGVMKRAILNLGDTSRWVAVLDIPSSIVKNSIKDPYFKNNYKNMLTSIKKYDIFLIETAPSGYKRKEINGLFFDSFTTVHCGFGKKGEIGAVLSHWIQGDPFSL